MNYICITLKQNVMTTQIFNSIQTATKDTYPGTCWYSDPQISKDLYIAEKNGWILRPSHTQCEWTRAGIDASNDINL